MQKFTSLKFHHPHGSWRVFLFLKIVIFDSLIYETKFQHAGFTLLGRWWRVPHPHHQLKVCSFPTTRKTATYQIFIPPTKWQFSCYNPVKTSLLAVVVVPVRAYCRNLGLCSILARSSIFLKKNYIPPSPIQSLFQVFYIKTKLCIIFGKEGSVRQLNAICCF